MILYGELYVIIYVLEVRMYRINRKFKEERWILVSNGFFRQVCQLEIYLLMFYVDGKRILEEFVEGKSMWGYYIFYLVLM